MRTKLLVLISLIVTSAAAAEALRLPPAERPQAGATAAPLKGAAGKARGSSCASYGPHFVMVEGTGTCVKIDGAISVDTTVRR
ncbi:MULTISPECIES: hypothetical protein [Bradyrhizobium]|uniref:Porin n=1 Tax=Bradyrhizobium frederickii TaxID=2560054 RepID=A0A4Y9KXY5_9BRAD|nr:MULTISPECIES: hypothetical protein [Bradyrhizobium]RTE88633.1 hypothetical protein D6B98_34620 [Bradyrhizobium sp. LVM 105]TFV34532.1 hypothetical protein E4K66_30655 [Bradyrhizobium frederickii]